MVKKKKNYYYVYFNGKNNLYETLTIKNICINNKNCFISNYLYIYLYESFFHPFFFLILF